MNLVKETKEKTCTFYASDYHFEMISLPYIEKKIENNGQILILTENNLEETIKNLLSKMNFSEEKKEKILKLNWKNDNLGKFKQIKNEVNNKKDIVIFIKGKENYIKNVNENIEKWTNNRNKVKIIGCYDIEEVGKNMNNIMDKYKKILGTSGERDIGKL